MMSHFQSLFSPLLLCHLVPPLLSFSFIYITRSLPSSLSLNYYCQGSEGGGLWTSVTAPEPSVSGETRPMNNLTVKNMRRTRFKKVTPLSQTRWKATSAAAVCMSGFVYVCVVLGVWLCLRVLMCEEISVWKLTSRIWRCLAVCVCRLSLREVKYVFQCESLMGNSISVCVWVWVCVWVSRLLFWGFYRDTIKWAVTAVTHLVGSHSLPHQSRRKKNPKENFKVSDNKLKWKN